MEKFIRITPNPSSNQYLSDYKSVFEQLNITTYVISEETSPRGRRHYHAYIVTDKSNERLRYQLKKHLDAQVYISGKDVLDKLRAIAYTIKDGNYESRGVDILTMMMAETISFKKVTFQTELDEISVTETSDYIHEVLKLYAKYKKRIYPQHIAAFVRSKWVERDDDYAKRLAEIIYMDIL